MRTPEINIRFVTRTVFVRWPGLRQLLPSSGAVYVFAILSCHPEGDKHLAALDTIGRMRIQRGEYKDDPRVVEKYLLTHGLIKRPARGKRASIEEKMEILHTAGWVIADPKAAPYPDSFKSEQACFPPKWWISPGDLNDYKKQLTSSRPFPYHLMVTFDTAYRHVVQMLNEERIT